MQHTFLPLTPNILKRSKKFAYNTEFIIIINPIEPITPIRHPAVDILPYGALMQIDGVGWDQK